MFMCVFHVNGPNRFRAKSIGIGLKSHVNVVMDYNHKFWVSPHPLASPTIPFKTNSLIIDQGL